MARLQPAREDQAGEELAEAAGQADERVRPVAPGDQGVEVGVERGERGLDVEAGDADLVAAVGAQEVDAGLPALGEEQGEGEEIEGIRGAGAGERGVGQRPEPLHQIDVRVLDLDLPGGLDGAQVAGEGAEGGLRPSRGSPGEADEDDAHRPQPTWNPPKMGSGQA